MLNLGKKDILFSSNMKKTILFLSIFALLTSCSGKADPDVLQSGDPICFSIPQDLSSKAPVYTDEQLTGTNPEVHIYGVQSGTVMPRYNNARLTYSDVTGLWAPSTSDTWGYDTDNDKGVGYSFWAYGFNSENSVGAAPSLTVSGDNFGKKLTLVEPASYVHQESGFGYDYLLSQRFDATSYKVVIDGEPVYRGPVVHLHMEHALALIEVRMIVHKDMSHVVLQGVELRDFYRGATMECTYHANYGNSTGATNRWSISGYTNSGAVYSRGSVAEGDGNTSVVHDFAAGRGEDENEIRLMLFTAIPQKPTGATLKIAMRVQEVSGSPEHQVISTWNLNNYYDWEYGYRNVYTINVDTSEKLDATIDDWPVVNNVSGTILPKIQEPSTEPDQE